MAKDFAPANDTPQTGVRNPGPVADALARVLSDTYRLLIKTHIYHWNVVGPNFYSVHTLTEEQYEDIFAATDALAERIRALGKFAPMSMKDMLVDSPISSNSEVTDASEMVADLAADNERLALRLHALIKIAEDNRDPVTADLATARSAFHEKAAWMLRATASA